MIWVCPSASRSDSQGNVFVAGLFSTVVEEIPAAGGYSTVKSLAGGFTSPQGIAVDGSDNLYLFDDNAAWKLPVSGGYSTATKLGSGFPGANGIAADAAGDVFLVGFGTSGIQEALVVNNYANLTHIGTPGFSVPAGIAIDASGNVYVADTGNNAVKEMTAASGFATVKTIGNGFVNPSGVTVDTNGNVFVADTGNNAVTEVLADGSQKILGDKLAQPTAVAVDISGDVFFANQQGLLEITTAGAVNSVVNQPGFFSGVALDSNGNLFLSNNDPIVTTGSEVRERWRQPASSRSWRSAAGSTCRAASRSTVPACFRRRYPQQCCERDPSRPAGTGRRCPAGVALDRIGRHGDNLCDSDQYRHASARQLPDRAGLDLILHSAVCHDELSDDGPGDEYAHRPAQYASLDSR